MTDTVAAGITPHLTPEQIEALTLHEGAHDHPESGHCFEAELDEVAAPSSAETSAV